MTDRNNYEKAYYVDRDGNRVSYDPQTQQPPVVYGEAPFTEADIEPDEELGDEGLIHHYSHGEFEPVEQTQPTSLPVAVPNVPDQSLSEEEGKFHIRYYGTVEHCMTLPPDPNGGDRDRGGLISMSIRDDLESHLHTDIHTYKPLVLLGEGNVCTGQKVVVDIHDWDSVIADYIYNYPYQLFPAEYEGDPNGFARGTFVELGQWDGNKKMRLVDFLSIIAKAYGTDLGDLTETLDAYVRDRAWIDAVPTQIGMSLDPDDAWRLPYSHIPKPALKGSVDYNPATRIAGLSFDFVDYILKPAKTDERIYEMVNPKILKSGTIPSAIRPKQPMRLTSYAHVTVRSGCSVVLDEDTDVVDLLLQTDGSVLVDGTLYFQHHEPLSPGKGLVDRWRVEISADGAPIFL